ncbi:hypothetical protein GCM10025768_18100 [Microbacterium pseudoresistens]|uniref:DUF402 domain-containing protein n=1 Tax=Microbacterium pseudoresistens TaxID=640634 RepID=A0A7Y9EX31_9MICO|nr:DUF402 domain-containing protein [Microbacterium pseudoresistens]NYD55503.1 hypothetical protein [Microbacterium pseudoresistens]
MRLPIGSTSVSASGGTVALIGRRGDGWDRLSDGSMSVGEALDALAEQGSAAVHADPSAAAAVPSDAPDAPRFVPGDAILWRYARHIEAVRVVRDDDRGLVIWIPSGSARLESAPADGRAPREVPLEERFLAPWVMREAVWRGPGIVRAAPTGMPWSVWFFRRADGTPDGAYVNLELPHQRTAGEAPGVFTRDLVLDLWIDAEHPGSEDVWLKDADELEAAVAQGRFTTHQAEAVRVLADHACDSFVAAGAWPLDEGWASWMPGAGMDDPPPLPDTDGLAVARRRSGRTGLEG